MQEPWKEKFWVWQCREDMSGNDGDTDNQDKEMLVVIFATAGTLSHLGRADIWYGDGNFLVYPNLFYQLYTIHAAVHGQIVPLVFSLLPSKSKRYYTFMWLQLKELMIQRGVSPNLKGFRSDLEPAPFKTLLPIFAPDSVST